MVGPGPWEVPSKQIVWYRQVPRRNPCRRDLRLPEEEHRREDGHVHRIARSQLHPWNRGTRQLAEAKDVEGAGLPFRPNATEYRASNPSRRMLQQLALLVTVLDVLAAHAGNAVGVGPSFN